MTRYKNSDFFLYTKSIIIPIFWCENNRLINRLSIVSMNLIVTILIFIFSCFFYGHYISIWCRISISKEFCFCSGVFFLGQLIYYIKLWSSIDHRSWLYIYYCSISSLSCVPKYISGISRIWIRKTFYSFFLFRNLFSCEYHYNKQNFDAQLFYFFLLWNSNIHRN